MCVFWPIFVLSVFVLSSPPEPGLHGGMSDAVCTDVPTEHPDSEEAAADAPSAADDNGGEA